MIYRISKVTVRREKEGIITSKLSFKVSHETQNLKAYRESMKSKFQVNKVELTYSEIT
jgi:hypothetical protein